MSTLADLEIFVKVVEEESFTRAADSLGVSKSYVSKQVRALEDRLGARLLNRTTRQQSLTDVGSAFYSRARQILADLEEAELAVTQMQSTPRGTLRLSVPMSFALGYLNSAIADFMIAYPDLDVDVSLADRIVDLIDEGFDLAVRIGVLSDSSLFVRRIAPIQRLLVASPDYLDAHGTPSHPDDLAQHQCLIYAYISPTWSFRNADGDELQVTVSGPYRANNGEALREAACKGLGLAVLPDFLICDQLRSGELVKVIPEWCKDNAAVWALYPHNRHLSAKVRLFVDFLVDRFSPEPPWV